MRWIALTVFFSTYSLAQTIDTGTGTDGLCTEATISEPGTYNCLTLTIDSPLTVSKDTTTIPTPPNLPLVIKVQGDVTINASLSVSGESSSFSTTSTTGNTGGPGAGDGGAYTFGSNDAEDSAVGGGKRGINGACAGGGGGGSFSSLGIDGTACPSGSAGGSKGLVTYDPFTSTFRGGYGGGSGGEGTPVSGGGGGGGGGALHIMAGGNVVINANLSARGGNGGSAGAGQNGGPGGGGSGGVIWIQTLGQITNNGTIDVSGGSGGTSPQGTRGGNGGNGVFKLEDADGVIAGTGSGTSASSSKLTSSISCGSLTMNDRSTLPEAMLGFSLIALLQVLAQRLKRLRYSEAKS